MTFVKTFLAMFAMTMLCVVDPATAGDQNPDIVKGNDIIGTPVHNFEGKELGHIADLAVDEHTGYVQYAVLSHGGMLGFGGKYFAIPWEVLKISGDKSHFVLDVKKRNLDEAPGFDKSDWPDFGDPTTFVVIHEFYEVPVPTSASVARSSKTSPEEDLPKEMKGGTVDEIQPTVSDAIEHARQAIDAGKKGDAKRFVAHVQSALEKAKDAQRAGHNEYLNEGVYELGEAIEHGRKKQTKDATDHVRHAIMRLSQAADLQIPD